MKKYTTVLAILFLSIKIFAQPGSLFTGFGNGGKINQNISLINNGGQVRGSVLQADGKILVILNAGYCATVIRIKTNGTLDSTYGVNGYGTYIGAAVFNGIALQADGKVVVAGGYYNSASNTQTLMARYTTAGVLDTTFSHTGIVLNGTFATYNNGICPGSNTSFTSDAVGATYQWQLNTGNEFTNLRNTAPYSTVTTNTLTLTAPATNLYGYQYRAVINGVTFSQTHMLKFASEWTGAISTAWEITGNWSCGAVLDANTDVYINPGKSNYPRVNSTRSVRSVRQAFGTTISVEASQRLTITGK